MKYLSLVLAMPAFRPPATLGNVVTHATNYWDPYWLLPITYLIPIPTLVTYPLLAIWLVE